MSRVRLRRAGALAALLAAALPASAGADSLVYVKDHDLWLARPDGSGQHRVTTDGSAASPYRSPSQADDGTIAAGHGQEVVRLRQNGEAIGRFDPPALVNSAGDHVDGPPVQVALSPDGARIAWTVVGSSCPVGAGCGIRAATGVTSADGTAPPSAEAITPLRNPSWATNARLLQFGGYGAHVNVVDLGGGGAVHWFDDQDVVGGAGTDLGDGELSSDGRWLAAVRGYGESTHLVWYDVLGEARSGPPPEAPLARCATNEVAGLASPTWSPAGDALAWAIPAGVLVKRAPRECAAPQPALVLPGASQPDWGPADIAPTPRTPVDGGSGQPPAPVPPAPPAPAPGPGPPPAGDERPNGPRRGGRPALSARLVAAPLGRVVRAGGFALRVRVPAAGGVRATARLGRTVVGAGSVRTSGGGERTVRVRLSRAGARTLRAQRSARLTVRVAFSPRAGRSSVATVAVTLRR